jgi:hypothetical protein
VWWLANHDLIPRVCTDYDYQRAADYVTAVTGQVCFRPHYTHLILWNSVKASSMAQLAMCAVDRVLLLINVTVLYPRHSVSRPWPTFNTALAVVCQASSRFPNISRHSRR